MRHKAAHKARGEGQRQSRVHGSVCSVLWCRCTCSYELLSSRYACIFLPRAPRRAACGIRAACFRSGSRSRRLGPKGEAAGRRGPAGMVEHVAEGDLIETGRPSQREHAVASEGGRERRLRGNGEKALPARKPSGSS